jgi:hypothetical protein
VKENGVAGMAGDRSQDAEEHCRPKGKTGEQDHPLKIFLALRIGLVPTRRSPPLGFWQQLNQLPADGQIVRWLQSIEEQPSDNRRERFGGHGLR